MREIGEIRFRTDGTAENRRFIERYVLDAVDRLPETEACDRVALMPFTHEAVGGGDVWITVAGDLSAIVEGESEAWNDLVEAGVVSDWDATEVTDDWYGISGERGGELLFRLHHVANRMTMAAFEEFDERPAAVDAHPEEESKHPIGWWMALHIATAHLEYSFEEMADAFLYALRHTYEDVDEFDSPDGAIRHLDDCIRSLETLRDDLEERRS